MLVHCNGPYSFPPFPPHPQLREKTLGTTLDIHVQQIDPARTRTQTSRSGVQRTELINATAYLLIFYYFCAQLNFKSFQLRRREVVLKQEKILMNLISAYLML